MRPFAVSLESPFVAQKNRLIQPASRRSTQERHSDLLSWGREAAHGKMGVVGTDAGIAKTDLSRARSVPTTSQGGLVGLLDRFVLRVEPAFYRAWTDSEAAGTNFDAW